MTEIFKVYEETSHGYEFSSQIYDIYDLFSYLDYIVYNLQPNHKVLVVKRTIELKQDETFYLYFGNYINTENRYEELKRKEIRRKQLEEIQYCGDSRGR